MGASRTPVPSPVHLQRAASRGGTVALGRPRPRLGLVFPQGADLPMTRGGIWRRFCASGPPPPPQPTLVCVLSFRSSVTRAQRRVQVGVPSPGVEAPGVWEVTWAFSLRR